MSRLQEDARWSVWTNSIVRKVGPTRWAPKRPGIVTYMLAGALLLGAVVGLISLVIFVLGRV